ASELRVLVPRARPHPRSPLFPSRRSSDLTSPPCGAGERSPSTSSPGIGCRGASAHPAGSSAASGRRRSQAVGSQAVGPQAVASRSEEHTSELQSHLNLVCRLLLEKNKKKR